MIYTVAIIAYLLGSLPFGLILTRLFGYGDIRKIGSGNIGATNVLRTGNKLLALLTLILDIGKGAIATAIAYYVFKDSEGFITLGTQGSFADESGFIFERNFYALIAGICAVIGHIFPIWLKFKGGKGVATVIGVILANAPYSGLFLICVWLATAFLFRYSSLAALVALVATPIFTYFNSENSWLYASAFALINLLIIIKHKDNIVRLIKGQESKITFKRKEMHVKKR
jgi:glycerol-3-phosphate acyltransferase PlsY